MALDARDRSSFGGSIANYAAAGLALNELTKAFITHLHVDHFGSLPYLYEFGGWAGRWHEPLTVYGPSGASEEYGTKWIVDGMLKMLNWHTDAFDVFPSGNQIRVVEFDFKDDGGVIYEKDGATVRHWRRSHAKDGASGYRLDWKTPKGENLCFVPDSMKKAMGEAARDKAKAREAHGLK